MPKNEKVSVRVDSYEWYPCYNIDNEPCNNSPCYEATISKKQLDDWENVMREFSRDQKEMEKIVCSKNFRKNCSPNSQRIN